jgi:transposase
MKAYSLDLRQKIVTAYDNQEGSLREIAKRFKVSLSFVLPADEAISGNWKA